MAGGAGSKRQIELAQRRQNALALRLQGGSYREIAEAIREAEVPGAGPKYSHTAAYDDVMFVLREIRAQTREDAEELVTLEEQRLDAIIASLWARVIENNDYFALDRLLAVMDRRWRLLGIGAPQKVALTDPTGTKEYAGLSPEQRMAELTALFDRARTRQGVEAAGAGTDAGGPARTGDGEGDRPGGLETEPRPADASQGVPG